MAINYPGVLNQAELATELLIRSIKINGQYLLCEDINFNQTQEIEASSDYIQGGPGTAIANIGAKKFTGSISFPISFSILLNFIKSSWFTKVIAAPFVAALAALAFSSRRGGGPAPLIHGSFGAYCKLKTDRDT